MNLANPIVYSCASNDILSFDVSSHGGSIVSAYIADRHPMLQLSYSILDPQNCLENEIITKSSISSPLINFVNTNNIDLTWNENNAKIGKYSRVDLTTQNTTTDTICTSETSCRIGLAKNDPNSTLTWTNGPNNCKTIKFVQYIQNTITQSINACAIGVADVAVENDNTAVAWATFQGPENNNYDIKVQAFPDGNPVPLTVNTFKTGEQSSPSLAITNSFIGITWRSIGQVDSHDIYFRAFSTNGRFISSEKRINNYTPDAQTNSVIAGHKGIFAIGWTSIGQDHGRSRGIYGQLIFANGTTIGHEFQINNITEGNQQAPKVVPGPGNAFTYLWLGPYLGKIKIFSRIVYINDYVEDTVNHDSTQTQTLPQKSYTPSSTKTSTIKLPERYNTPSNTETPIPISTRSASLTFTSSITSTHTAKNAITRSTSTTPTNKPPQTNTIDLPLKTVSPALPNIEAEDLEQPQVKPTDIPPQVKQASVATASAVAATSVAPTTAGAGLRINSIAASTSCEEYFYRNNTFTLSPVGPPNFGFLLGDTKEEEAYSNLIYSSALYLGSFVLLACIANFAPASIAVAAQSSKILAVLSYIGVHFPGNFLPISMFLGATTITSAITIMKFGNTKTRILAGIGLIPQIGSGSHYIYQAMTGQKEWSAMKGKRIPYEGQEQKFKKNKVPIQDYRTGKEWFICVDLAIYFASNSISSVPSSFSECGPTKHINTAIYSIYTGLQLSLQPHDAKHHKVAHSLINTLITSTVVINSVQEILPDLKNTTILNDIAEGSLVAATAITTVIGLWDLGSDLKTLYTKISSAADADISSHQSASVALLVPPPQHAAVVVGNTPPQALNNPLNTQQALPGQKHYDDNDDFI